MMITAPGGSSGIWKDIPDTGGAEVSGSRLGGFFGAALGGPVIQTDHQET
jgi:hypothetical protein